MIAGNGGILSGDDYDNDGDDDELMQYISVTCFHYCLYIWKRTDTFNVLIRRDGGGAICQIVIYWLGLKTGMRCNCLYLY